MVTLYGQTGALGCAVGILIPKSNEVGAIMYPVEDLEEELKLFDQAREIASKEYEYLIEEARKSFGNAVAMMVWAHHLLIQDPGFHIKVKEIMKDKKCSANHAIHRVAKDIVAPMQDNEDLYLKERAKDILYIADWLSNCYCRIRSNTVGLELEPPAKEAIQIGEDFGLEDLILAKKNKIVGFLDKKGSIESHTVMLAKELSIPMLLCISEEIEQYIEHSATLNATQGFVHIE